jgi:ADP-ribose pyrophosphatase
MNRTNETMLPARSAELLAQRMPPSTAASTIGNDVIQTLIEHWVKRVPIVGQHGRLAHLVHRLAILRVWSARYAHRNTRAHGQVRSVMFRRRSQRHSWRTCSSAIAYNRQIQVIEDLVSTPDDGEFVYVYVRSPHDIVAILAITENRQVVLVREYCHPMRKIIYTLPSGSILEGEVPSQAARRQLAEQAGYCAHQLTPLGRMVPFPEAVVGTIHLFLAGGLHLAPRLPGAHTERAIVLINVDEALKRTLRGEFEDGALQLALLFAAQQRLF